MKISDIMTEKNVVLGLKANSKRQLLQELSDKAAEITGINERTIFDIVLERENLGSTGFGGGTALPHGRIPELDKVYGLFAKVDSAEKASADDLRAMHKCILAVTERIDQMKFNTAVSSMMTYVNYLSAKTKIAPELYSTLIKLLSPFTPHLAEEMWARLGNTTLVIAETWPQGDAKLAEDQVVTYAVQLCGKMRGTIEMPKDAGKEEIQAQAMALENVKRQIEGKEIVKVIVVPNRLINIVVKG